MKKIFITFIISALFLPSFAFAEEAFPSWPMAFYGTATFDSNPLPAGTKIQAFSGDALVGEVEMSEVGTYGYNNPLKTQLLVKQYVNELLFKYIPVDGTDAVTGNDEVKYTANFSSGDVVEFNLSFTAIPSTPNPPSGGGGGGSSSGGNSGGGGSSGSSGGGTSGGSGTSGNADSYANDDDKNDSEEVPVLGDVAVLGVEYDPYQNLKSLYGQESSVVEIVSGNEADAFMARKTRVDLNDTEKTIYEKLTAGHLLNNTQKFSLAYFIKYGSPTTHILGAGERAGAYNSFVSAFGYFPETREDWKDVIKIANGRWPSKSNEVAEIKAKKEFRKIYLRDADLNNSHDNAAVTVMAYGLRPANRNMESEAVSIKTFFAIYKKNPNTASEWDVVRAIAYSGAVR